MSDQKTKYFGRFRHYIFDTLDREVSWIYVQAMKLHYFDTYRQHDLIL